MNTYELRDPGEARRFLTQGLWWQRVLPPSAATVRPALEWAMELATEGNPLPPVGLIADLGHVALGMDWEAKAGRESPAASVLPMNRVRTYEDHVLGKVYADWSFQRAGDALRRYEGRDRARGLAFLVNQFRQRAGFAGVDLSPGVVKSLLDSPPEEVLSQGWESLQQDGVLPLLVDLYESLIAAARRTAEVLSMTDVFELEKRTALNDLGQRVGLRQVLDAAHAFEANLSRHRIRPLARRMEVPTRILDEDTYPVGGFTSISTRGTIESLLHSQLAFMEKDERPDLFDIKFVRDELLYYSRDENQFLRRRRTFVFVLDPDLVATRFKDADLPYQRGVLLLALLAVVVRRLSDWLSTDALSFRFLFPAEGEAEPLAAERGLLGMVLRESVEGGTTQLERIAADRVAAQCTQWGRRSLCHCLLVGTRPGRFHAEDATVTRLAVNGPRPALGDEYNEPAVVEGDDPQESWSRALEEVLRRWIS